MMVAAVAFLSAFSAVAGQSGARPKLYIRAKHDGCGAQAQQAVHLVWVADALGFEAGGIVGDAGRSSHGWACDALLGGLGLPRLGADARACASAAPATWRGLGPLAANASVACVVYERDRLKLGPDLFRGDGARWPAPLAARRAAAARGPDALPPPSRKPRGAAVVAVHVRRGDVGPGNWTSRYAPNAWYATLMASGALRRRFGGGPLEFRVYSEGLPADFSDLAALGAVLRLGGDPLQAVADFLDADVLVLSKSSFSFVPALFREGPVVFTSGRWVRPPLDAWVDARDLGLGPPAGRAPSRRQRGKPGHRSS